MKAPGLIASALLAVAASLLSLALAEATLRIAVRPPDIFYPLDPGVWVFQADPRYVTGIEGPAEYAVNQWGLRSPPFGPDSAEFRILQVGGSTTESRFLAPEENWGGVLSEELDSTRSGLDVWVGNAGRSGLTSRDHVVTIKYALPGLPPIDLVILLVGVNDMTAALRQGWSYVTPPSITEPDAEAVQIRNAFAVSPLGRRRELTGPLSMKPVPWYQQLYLYEITRRARGAFAQDEVRFSVGGAEIGVWRGHRAASTTRVDSLPDLEAPLREYRRNLHAAAAAARENEAQVLFMTQPSIWRPDLSPEEDARLWLGGIGPFQDVPGQPYYSPRALAAALDQYNRATLDVCAELDLPCLDLAPLIPRDTTMFWDDVHLTTAGAALIGRSLAQHLRDRLPATFR